MKRNLLAVFLAVMVLSALVFFVAPSAKAEDSKAVNLVTLSKDTTGENALDIEEDTVLDLAGFDATVNIAKDDVTLSVIDTSFMVVSEDRIDFSGDQAGKLTVAAESKGTISTVYQNGFYHYLKVANNDGTYSFHPFNMDITAVGINTLAGKNNDTVAICLRATFIANNVVRDKFTDYGVINETLKVSESSKENYPFGNKNGIHAFFDVTGSLDAIDATNAFKVYVKFGEGENAVFDYSASIDITPREVLKKINKDNVTPTDAQKGRLDELFKTNTRVANILTNMQTTTKDEIVTGTLTFVEGNRVASSGTQQTWQQNGVTLIYDKGSYNQSLAEYANPARFYAGTKLTVNMIGMTQIVFDCNSGTYANDLKTSIGTVSGATVSVNSDKVTVTFTNAVDSFAVAKLTAQVRMDSMTVTATKTITNIVTCKHGTNLSEATCSKQAVCIDCDQPYGETTDHDTIVEATCTEKAKCSVCGEYGEALGHDDTEVATCHSAAVCTRCGEHGGYNANNHTAYVKPTCTKLGYCTDCEADGLGELASHNYENGECTACGEKDPNANKVQLLATFALGANGSASHNDGTSKASYSETNNGYTLNLTSGTNMYTGARDAKGNSCIKLGSSSKAGSFKFTVPENVTEVVIYIAKYKANTTKISVNNGTSQTLTKSSNDGAYDVITIDTTTNKTITLTTQSGGYRAMMNTIEFHGYK